jgi:hypothetical protein
MSFFLANLTGALRSWSLSNVYKTRNRTAETKDLCANLNSESAAAFELYVAFTN